MPAIRRAAPRPRVVGAVAPHAVRVAPLALSALALAAPATARAATYHASQTGTNATTCPAADPCSLAEAVALADATSERDAVRMVGPLTHTSVLGLALSGRGGGIDLVGSGAGPGGTLIEASNGNGNAVVLVGATSSVRDLRVVNTIASGGAALALAQGARASHVAASGPSGLRTVFGVPGGEPARIDHAEVSGGLTGMDLNAPAVITDSTATGPYGISASGSAGDQHTIQRTRIAGSSRGVLATGFGAGPTISLSSSTVSLAADPTVRGLDVWNANLAASNVTVVGGGRGIGVRAGVDESVVTLTATTVTGFETGFAKRGAATLSASSSNFAPSPLVADGGGNVDVAPGFVNAAAGDLRLAPDSPLIDRGGTATPPAGESPTDLRGLPRVASTGPVAARDIGAYEYAAPRAALTLSAGLLTTATPVTLDAGGSTYAEAPLTAYRFDLDGDGAFETAAGGAQLTTTLARVGSYDVGVRVRGGDGAGATAAVPVTVAAAPPGDGPPGAAAAADRAAPRVTGLTARPRVFAVARGRTALAVGAGERGAPVVPLASGRTAPVARAGDRGAPVEPLALGRTALAARAGARGAPPARGTRLRMHLSEPADLALEIRRLVPGRRGGGRCVAPRRGSRAGRKPCTRQLVRATLLRRSRPAGANAIPFTGRVGARALPAGRWLVRVVATDAAGNRSRPREVRLRIVRPR